MKARTPIDIVRVALVVMIAIVLAIAFVVTQQIATRRAMAAEAARGQAAAVLLASSFRRELEKFRLGTVVLARDPEARTALIRREPADIALLNAKFEALSTEMRSAAVYLLDAEGKAIAASNWRLPTSFVGLSYAFRAYFKDAMINGVAGQFALGTRSRRPGLYIAHRIDSNIGVPIGVVVVKVEFDALEAEWRAAGNRAFATNELGIILVTSVPRWRFQTTAALDNETRRQIRANLEFGPAPLVPNPLFADGSVALAAGARSDVRPLIESVQRVDENWTVHVLGATRAPVAAAVASAQLILLTIVMAIGGIAALFAYRRRVAVRQAERRAMLRVEELKQRLAQANKLATLGQIAAGVGHEINQPVTAIGTYAHNSTLLIDAGQLPDARDNMARIVALTARIGSITGELRGFARRATGMSGTVSIHDAIRGALLLLGDRIRSTEARIDYASGSTDVNVVGEHVRLEQVLVNLLQNALDAGGKQVVIRIDVAVTGSVVEVVVADDGPGLSAPARAALFQPFSTSKPDGLGLGLVISRDIMIDFGGDLVARDPPTGAEFLIRLEAAS